MQPAGQSSGGGRARGGAYSYDTAAMQAAMAASRAEQSRRRAAAAPSYSSLSPSLGQTAISRRKTPRSITPGAGDMQHLKMPADNSCLFHSVAFTCDGARESSIRRAMVQRLRVKAAIEADPERFTRAALGMDPRFYCHAVLDHSFWGGGPELGIFSALYHAVVYVFYLQEPTCVRFGRGKSYDKMIFLVYSGTHYDVLAFRDKKSGQVNEVFRAQDTGAVRAAKDMVELLHLSYAKKINTDAYGRVIWKSKWLLREAQGRRDPSPSGRESNASSKPARTAQPKIEKKLSIEEEQIQRAIAASLSPRSPSVQASPTAASKPYNERAQGWGWKMSPDEVENLAGMGSTILSQVLHAEPGGTGSV